MPERTHALPRRPGAAAPRLAALCLAAWLFLIPSAAPAWQLGEWGLGIFAHTDTDIQGGDLGGVGACLAVAGPMWEGRGLRLDFRLEAAAAGFWNYASGLEVSLVPSLRLYLPRLGGLTVTPYCEGGLGPSWDHLHIRELGSEFNFLSFGGLGVRLPLEGCRLDLGYRLRHISNGGMDERNHGVTSHLLLLALAWDM